MRRNITYYYANYSFWWFVPFEIICSLISVRRKVSEKLLKHWVPYYSPSLLLGLLTVYWPLQMHFWGKTTLINTSRAWFGTFHTTFAISIPLLIPYCMLSVMLHLEGRMCVFWHVVGVLEQDSSSRMEIDIITDRSKRFQTIRIMIKNKILCQLLLFVW